MIITNDMIKNNKKFLKKIESSIKTILNDSEIYLFGSILKGDLVAGSDVDILIIADVPKKHLKRAVNVLFSRNIVSKFIVINLPRSKKIKYLLSIP